MKLKFLSIYLFLALGLISFSSCEKENLDLTTTEEETIDPIVVSCNLTLNIAEQPPGSGALYAAVSGGAAPYTYEWSTGETGDDIRVDVDGTYTVTVTDAEGCIAEQAITITITVDPCQSFATTVEENADGTITTTATGGTVPYAYVWSTGEITATITPASNGTFSVTVTDAEGCTSSASILVEGDLCDDLILTVEEESEGVFTATVSGGTAPYLFVWSDGTTGSTASFTVSGVYTVRVIDAEGCSTEATVTYTSSDPCESFWVGIGEQPPGSGTLYATPIAGTLPYAYLWSTGETTSSINGSTGNTYSVTVTDANGCTASSEIQL